MSNQKLIKGFLRKTGQYPTVSNENSDGLKIAIEHSCLLLKGNPCDLIELADLLLSLALSGKNNGQHWHIDTMTVLSEHSPISELILERTD